MKTTEPAYAKINLSIDVLSRMPSGYHSMRMVMQSISLADEVEIACAPGEGIAVATNLRFLPGDERNTAARAAAAFLALTGITGYRVEINIKKSIPVCAGLGGGSADGAAVLRGLDRLLGTRLGRRSLESLAEQVGSDVPFCVSGGTSLAEGRGERLTDLPDLPDCFVVVCKPSFSISTPELFARINCEKIRLRPDTDGLVESLSAGDLPGVARRMYNVFEDVLPKGTGEILEIKERLLDSSALGAVMTGTGSAVFGLFADEKSAMRAYDDLKGEYPECFVARPLKRLEIGG